MMKVSDPIIFGHVVRAYFADVYAQHGDALFAAGLDGLSEAETRARLVKIERLLSEMSSGKKFYGHMYDDVLHLKYLHQRYTNYARWLTWRG